MKKPSLISVIVVTYNQEQTIARTLDSILSQQCHLPVEIVIGEDCSTDRTRDICQEYAQRHPSRVRLLCNERNKGVIDNYFDCLLACRGELIADCAGDDFWVDSQKLEKESRLMETHPEVTLVHTNWKYYDEQTGCASSSGHQPYDAAFTDGHQLLIPIAIQTERPVIHLCTALYRADTLRQALAEDQFLFRNKAFGCEDIQVCFEAARRGVIAYLPDVTLHYSIGHDSVSNQHDPRKQFEHVKAVSRLGDYLIRKHRLSGPATADYFARRAHALAMHAFRAHSPELRDATRQLADEWKAPRNKGYTLAMAAMRWPSTWALALCLRNLVVRLKRNKP